MAEYIEREAAKRWLAIDYAYAAAKLLDEIPAADVVEVCRCKDCKHWTADGLGHPWCDMWEDYQYHEEVFCYFGERKAGDC